MQQLLELYKADYIDFRFADESARRIYGWLTYEAIESQQALDEELNNILRRVRSQYTIKFRKQSKKVPNIFTKALKFYLQTPIHALFIPLP